MSFTFPMLSVLTKITGNNHKATKTVTKPVSARMPYKGTCIVPGGFSGFCKIIGGPHD